MFHLLIFLCFTCVCQEGYGITTLDYEYDEYEYDSLNEYMNITVGPYPYFVLQPGSVNFDSDFRPDPNDAVAFECVAVSNPAPTYKWYRVNFDEDGRGDFLVDDLSDPRYNPRDTYLGPSDGALIINAPQDLDAGYYYCIAENVYGCNRSETVRLGFGSNPPELIFAPNSPKVCDGGLQLSGRRVELECLAYGYPVISYNWTRKGADLPHGAYTEGRFYNRSILVLPNVTVEDSGEYVCTASNGEKSDMREVELEIFAPPKFFIPLLDQVVLKGAKVTMVCVSFDDDDDTTYTWLKDGKDLWETLDVNDRNRYTFYKGILIIKEAEERDAGMYQCKATHDFGSDISSAQLKVISMEI